MTTEKAIENYFAIKKEYSDKVAEIKAKFQALEKEMSDVFDDKNNDIASVADKWANDNARFSVGDIIMSNNLILEISLVYGHMHHTDESVEMYVCYRGKAMTEDLKPVNKCTLDEIFDDGEYPVVLVKKSDD